MKGVSAIIAIILLVMISVSLAGLAWVWFFSVSNTLKNTAANATNTATSIVSMEARIEAARFYPTKWVNASFRNIGTVNISLAKLGVFIDGVLSTYSPNTGMLSPGNVETINITNTTQACGKVLKITFENGFEDYRTVTCT